MKYIVGSASERKKQVVEGIVREFLKDQEIAFEVYNASSGVPETPWDQETYNGAKNRAEEARKNVAGDYFVGLESGLVERYGSIYEEAWCAVITAEGKGYFGYSSGLKVPDSVLKKMDELKMQHCNVMELLEKKYGAIPSETWGNYSGGMVARKISLEEALRNALVQIFAPDNSFYKQLNP